jgi:hypothetical protein
MTSEQKPREFWISENTDGPFVFCSRMEFELHENEMHELEERPFCSAIHVIEYSALEQAQAEIEMLKRHFADAQFQYLDKIDELEAESEKNKNSVGGLMLIWDEMTKENAKLKDKISLLEQHLESSRRDRTILQDAAVRDIAKIKMQLSDAVMALEEVNRTELNNQRPGGGYSPSAIISYNALQKLKSE